MAHGPAADRLNSYPNELERQSVSCIHVVQTIHQFSSPQPRVALILASRLKFDYFPQRRYAFFIKYK